MKSGATFSDDLRYRYRLWRIWDGRKELVRFIGLNPSTADAKENDRTVSRCMKYARDWGYGGMVMVNLFAFRSTDPKSLYYVEDPVGPENDQTIHDVFGDNLTPVAMWGTKGSHMGRDQVVVQQLSRPMLCFKHTVNGYPMHPLYLRKDITLIKYEGRPWLKRTEV